MVAQPNSAPRWLPPTAGAPFPSILLFNKRRSLWCAKEEMRFYRLNIKCKESQGNAMMVMDDGQARFYLLMKKSKTLAD